MLLTYYMFLIYYTFLLHFFLQRNFEQHVRQRWTFPPMKLSQRQTCVPIRNFPYCSKIGAEKKGGEEITRFSGPKRKREQEIERNKQKFSCRLTIHGLFAFLLCVCCVHGQGHRYNGLNKQQKQKTNKQAKPTP